MIFLPGGSDFPGFRCVFLIFYFPVFVGFWPPAPSWGVSLGGVVVEAALGRRERRKPTKKRKPTKTRKTWSLGAPLRGRHRNGRRGAGVRMLIGVPRGLHNRASDESSFTPTKQWTTRTLTRDIQKRATEKERHPSGNNSCTATSSSGSHARLPRTQYPKASTVFS